MQDNLEFTQWLKKYWNENFPGEYDVTSRRKATPSAAIRNTTTKSTTPLSNSSSLNLKSRC